MKQQIQQLKDYIVFWNSKIDYQKLRLSPKRFTYLFFFLLSTTLWFLNRMSEEYVDSITFPLRFGNFPKHYVLLNEPTDELNLQVKAYGYSLLYYNLSPTLLPLRLNYRQLPLRTLQEGDTAIYFIETNYLNKELSHQLGTNIKLLKILPDTLKFKFTRTIYKRVPVSLRYNLQLHNPYRLAQSPQFRPDSVNIGGPQAIVNQTDSIVSQVFDINLDSDSMRIISLQALPNLHYSQQQVVVSTQIERYTQGEFSIPIHVRNCPDSLRLQVFPMQVTVRYTVGLKDFGSLKASGFRAEVDYKDAINSISQRIPIHIVAQPAKLKLNEHSPRQAEFILERR